GREEDLDPSAKSWIQSHQIDLECAGHTKDFLKESDVIVLSPGVRIDSDVVKIADDLDIPVLGEIEFAFQFCPKPVIAITGSNGKTTVSTLIHLTLQKAGYRSVLCGNVGQPFSLFIKDIEQSDYVIVEVSSFQMESLMAGSQRDHFGVLHLKGFKPYIAAVLNFSENHLDRHKDLQEYFDAKTRIFLNQDENDYAVLNGQYSEFKDLSLTLKAQIRFFNDHEQSEADLNANQKAVCQVANILGIDWDVCRSVFREFAGVEHRLEFVRALNGVDYINDSKATTAEAGRWALTNLQRPVIMICGGRDKNINFLSLKDIVRQKVKQMIVFGEAGQKLKDTFKDVVGVEQCVQLDAAVTMAREHATDGDCIVLSPMCASFDQFRDYEERGRIFKDIVNQLKP
ncbi:MAG: UDP-N-acetylmuramoyl-L-alanine--D-glutamate ligase, partial [Candidatus Omnitrophica bacterium]|nr:UDP-N-acetylmuramoyl-L-alanine--D-glutamate ligase [Candidatus Omnitrophota bacterium]